MKRLALFFTTVCLPALVFAVPGSGSMKLHSDPIAPIILGVTAILFFAVVGRYVARKFHQPSVLGELIVGIIVGNVLYALGVDLIIILREGPVIFDIMDKVLMGKPLAIAAREVLSNSGTADAITRALRGTHGIELLQVAHAVDVFSRYGVIFLLFLVGLESSIEELRQTGGSALRVGFIGLIAPMTLGFFATRLLMPEASLNTDLFIAATLGATSIGITARVLRDINQTKSQEAHIILGAAVLDDVLGLIILAIVSGIIVTGSVTVASISKTTALASLFIVSAFFIGPHLINAMIELTEQMSILEAKLFISFMFVMLAAWFANLVGLATIIGAFAAGLILHDGYFRRWGQEADHEYTIKDLVAPLEAILVPIFFILIGIQVKLEAFLDTQVILTAIGLIAAAMLGKMLSGFGAEKGTKRFAIGVGMMPRGEVGLVFASIGRSLEVISDQLFAAIVLMVIVTTLTAPPLLKRSMLKKKK